MSLAEIAKFEQRIFIIRGQKVMLSNHLAQLYNVETKVLMQAVKRNRERFPEDFMFQLENNELRVLKSQIVTSKTETRGGANRARAYAFTEQGVAMLSSVLKSDNAIQVNIAIMRAFVKLRDKADKNRQLAEALRKLEKKVGRQGEDIETIFAVLRQLTSPEKKQKRGIGFIS